MSSISIKSKVDMDIQAILEGIAQLDNKALESFA